VEGSKKGNMAEQLVRHGPTCGPKGLDGGLEIAVFHKMIAATRRLRPDAR
jgi:hypothetical protein